MAFPGWLMFGGSEIINIERTVTYIRALVPGLQVAPARHCEQVLHQVLGHTGPYTTPLDDNAPWYDPKVPESHGFAGMYPLEITGLDDDTRTSTVTQGNFDGGFITPPRRATREIHVSGLLVGENEQCVDYGLFWLRQMLDSNLRRAQIGRMDPVGSETMSSIPDPCGNERGDVNYLASCPELGCGQHCGHLSGKETEHVVDLTKLVPTSGTFQNVSGNWVFTPSGTGTLTSPNLPDDETCPVRYEWSILGTTGSTIVGRGIRDGELRDVVTMDVVARRINLAKNPQWKTAGPAVLVRKNLAVNPSLRTLCAPTLVTTNRVPNPRAGLNISGYQAVAGTGGTATLSRVATGGPLPSAPTFARLTWTVAQTAFTATPYISVGVNGDATYAITVAAGEKISGSFWMRTVDANQNITALLAYYDASGTQVGASVQAPTIIPNANTWTYMGVTDPGTVPATATQVRFFCYVPSGTMFLAGDTLDVTAFELVRSTPLLPYFDGASTARGGQTYAWAGAAHASASTATGYENLSRTNTALNAACRTGITGYGVDTGGGTVNLIYGTDSTLVVNGSPIPTYFRAAWVATPYDSTQADIWYGRSGSWTDLPVQGGQNMMFSCYARSNVFERVMFMEITYYGDGNTGVLQTTNSGPFGVGGTQFVRLTCFDSVPYGATHARMKLKVYAGAIIANGDTIDMTAVMAEITYDGILGAFFDGNTPDTATTDYDWAGAVGASFSYARGVGSAGRVVARTNWFLNPEQNGLYASGITSNNTGLYPIAQGPTRTITSRTSSAPSAVVSSVTIDGGAVPIPTTAGDVWTLSCDLSTSNDDRSYSAQVLFAPSGNGTAVGGVIPVAGTSIGPLRVSAQGTAPTGATSVSLRITVTTNSGNATTNEYVAYDNVLFEKVAGLRTYFSGDNISPSGSGLATQWEGTPYMSRSFSLGPCINSTLQGVNNTPFWQTDNISPAGGAVGSVFVIGDSGTGIDTTGLQRTNYAKNPVGRAASGTIEARRNKVWNGSGRDLIPASTIVGQNRFTNPKVGTNLTNWSATLASSGTITTTRQTNGDLVINGQAITTYQRMQVATVSTGAVSSTGHVIGTSTADGVLTLVPGQANTISVWFRTNTTVRTYALVATAHDSTGTQQNVVTGAVVTPVANQWMQATVQITPAAGATRGIVRVFAQAGSNWAVNDTLDATAVLVQPVAVLNPYFDGSTTLSGTTFAWTGTADASESTASGAYLEVSRNYFPTPSFRDGPAAITAVVRTNLATNPSSESGTLNWNSNNTASWVNSIDTTVFHSGTRCVLSTPQAAYIGTGVVLMSTYNVGGGVFGVTVGKVYTVSVWLRHNSSASMQGGRIGYQFLDSGGAQIGSTAYSSFVAMPQNTWTRVGLTTITVPANTVNIRVLAEVDKAVGVNVAAGETAWADDCLVEEGQVLRPYFDGTTVSAGINNYLTPTQSQPTATTGWTALSTPTLVTAPWDASRKAIQIAGTGAATAYIFTAQSSRALYEKGVTVTVSATVQAPVGTWLQPYVHNNTSNAYYGGGIVAPTVQATGLPQRVAATWTFTADEPNGATLNMAVLFYGGNSTTNNLPAGTQVYMGDVLIEECGQARPYFEGTTGQVAAWTGTASASTSVMRATATTNMTLYASVSGGSSAPFKTNFINYAGQPQTSTRVQSNGTTTRLGLRNTGLMTGMNAFKGGQRVYVRAKVRLDRWSGWPTLTVGTRGINLIGRDDTNNDSTLFSAGPSGGFFPNPPAPADSFTWTEVFGAYDIPANRNLEGLYITISSEGAVLIPAGIGVDFADVMVSNVPQPFYDGAMAATTISTYAWAGQPNVSASVRQGRAENNWTPTGGTVAQGTALTLSNGDSGFGIDLRGGSSYAPNAAVTPNVGDFYSARFTVAYLPQSSWLPTGAVPAINAQIYDGSAFVTAVKNTDLPTDGSSITFDVVANTPLSLSQARLFIYPLTDISGTFAAAPWVGLRVSEVIMCRVPGSGYPLVTGWFDGSTPATTDLSYGWTGTANASDSTATGSKPTLDNASTFPAVYRSPSHAVNTAAGEYALVAMPGGFVDINRAAGDTTLNGHIPALPTTISMTAFKASSAAVPATGQTVVLQLFSKPSGGSFTSQDTVVTVPVNGVIFATATVPAGSVSAYWRVQNTVGEALYFTQVLIENSGATNTYFDGAYPDSLGYSYDWTGATDASWSTYSTVSRLLLQGAGDTLVSPAGYYAVKFKVRQIGGTPNPANTIHIEGHYYGGGEDYGTAVTSKDVIVTSAWQEVCLPAKMIAPSTATPGLKWNDVSPSTTWDGVGPVPTWDTYTGP